MTHISIAQPLLVSTRPNTSTPSAYCFSLFLFCLLFITSKFFLPYNSSIALCASKLGFNLLIPFVFFHFLFLRVFLHVLIQIPMKEVLLIPTYLHTRSCHRSFVSLWVGSHCTSHLDLLTRPLTSTRAMGHEVSPEMK